MYHQTSFFHKLTETSPDYSAGDTATAEDASTVVPQILPQLLDAVANEFESRLTESQRKQLGRRLERARAIAHSDKVIFTDEPTKFKVRSSTVKGEYYYYVKLDFKPYWCSCPDNREGENICKHILASYWTMKAYEQSTGQDDQDFQMTDESPQVEEKETFDIASVVAERLWGSVIVYSLLIYEDEPIMVEVLATDGDQAYVRTLPVMDKDGALVPLFAFPSEHGTNVMCSTTAVNKTQLENIRIFRKE